MSLSMKKNALDELNLPLKSQSEEEGELQASNQTFERLFNKKRKKNKIVRMYSLECFQCHFVYGNDCQQILLPLHASRYAVKVILVSAVACKTRDATLKLFVRWSRRRACYSECMFSFLSSFGSKLIESSFRRQQTSGLKKKEMRVHSVCLDLLWSKLHQSVSSLPVDSSGKEAWETSLFTMGTLLLEASKWFSCQKI